MHTQYSTVGQDIAFEAMEIYPHHIQAAFTDIRREVAGDDPRHARAMIRAQHLMTYAEYWRDRVGVFHMESTTTPGTVYHVDATGACSCPANGVCKHIMAERADRYARNIARGEAWAHVRLQDGMQIWRTTTGYLACFDGQVIVHATQPHEARAALLDYQVGLLEHEQVNAVVPTHDLAVRMVNGMHSAYFAALVDAGLDTTRDVVAEQRARAARAAVVRIIVERAA